MSGGSKSQTQSTSSNTVDPAQMAEYQANLAGAKTRAASLTPYTGPITAGFQPAQTQAQGILTATALDPSYLQSANGSTATATGVQNSNPLTAADLQQYMNPFQSQVIDASVAQNLRARQIANTQDNMQNTAGEAFGGSRSGVANALTNEAYDRNDQQNLAALNTANFGQAQNASIAAKNLQLNAANSTANLNNNALNVATRQGGILSAVGDAQQAQLQKQLTDAYNAYTQGQNLTLAQQQLLNQALGIIPVQQTTNSNSSTNTQSNPGFAGILGGIGSLALAGATGGASLPFTGLGSSLLGSSPLSIAPQSILGGTLPGIQTAGSGILGALG